MECIFSFKMEENTAVRDGRNERTFRTPCFREIPDLEKLKTD